MGLTLGCTSLLGNDFEIASGPSESCSGGGDDDGDGLEDCADPDCATVTCVGAIPAGWTGPAARADVSHGAPLPPCPPDTAAAYSGFADLAFEPAVCGECSCTEPTVECTLADVDAYTTIGCATPPGPVTIEQSTTCQGTGAVDEHGSYTIAAPTVTLGSCRPEGGGVVDVPPHGWGSDVLLCASTVAGQAGGCVEGTCLPILSAAEFGSGYCIFQSGDLECPAPFLVKSLTSDGDEDIADDRDCSACECDEANGSCSVTTRIYGSLNVCGGALKATVPNDGVCHDASNEFSTSVELEATIDDASGSCPELGGEAQGSVVATGPFTTVCCTP
jgi:hypothetical protein